MEKKHIVGIATLSMIAMLGISLVAAAPFGKNYFNAELTTEDREAIKEKMQAMRDAIESEDYGAWESLMQERVSMMQAQIHEETFAKIVEIHKERSRLKEAIQTAKETGDWTEVKALREELGLEDGRGFKNRMHNFHR